jgi:ligand-binding sensor domain-containing protein
MLLALSLGWAPLAPAPTAAAQTAEPAAAAPGTWQTYPSMRRVQAIASGDGEIWAGTDGGVFRYDVASGEITRYTTTEGLARVDVRALAFDAARNALWVGYPNGILDRIDGASGEVTTFFDIARADRYPQRGINRILPAGDSLYVATDFGIVVFDTDRGEVRDTYDKFGEWDRGRAAHDFIEAPRPDGTPGFWVATDDGVAHARRDAPNLRVPSEWVIDPGAPGPMLAIAHHAGTIFGGRQRLSNDPGDMHRREADGSWTRLFVSDNDVFDFFPRGNEMIAAYRFGVVRIDASGEHRSTPLAGVYTVESAGLGPDGRLWVGSSVYGLGRLPDLPPSGPSDVETYVVPNGPLTNRILSVDLGPDRQVWVGYQTSVGIIDGIGRFDGTSWTSYSTLFGDDVPHANVRTLTVDRRGMAWGGTEGSGVVRVDSDGQTVNFRAHNSTLRGDPGFPNYIVVFGSAEDADGRVWFTNREAPNPLHVWDPEQGWTGHPRPNGMPATARTVADLYIDGFGQKWVAIPRTGFMVVRTGDPFDSSDNEAVAVVTPGSASTGTGLPNQNVRAFGQDLDGRLWIGTERGLATVFSPGSVFGSAGLATPAWARTPDQASYFLRDLNIFAIAVDPAGRKWLGSSDGAWLINDAGNEVLAHFTQENSPLPAGAILDIVIDEPTGTVYFATDQGLVSYRGDSIEPASRAERLQVYPNPFRPSQDPFVRVEGLVAETRIRILTPDGQVVAALEGRGGSITWDGRDQRTGQLVPSGVYLVAAAGRNGEGTAYGKIAVIR